jgi:hypothetical protein
MLLVTNWGALNLHDPLLAPTVKFDELKPMFSDYASMWLLIVMFFEGLVHSDSDRSGAHVLEISQQLVAI